MEALWDGFMSSLRMIEFRDIFDMLIVALLIYGLLVFSKQTRAMQLLKAVGIVLVAARISEWLGLTAISWILNGTLSAGMFAAVVLFQPELRNMMERLGRGRFLSYIAPAKGFSRRGVQDELVRALLNLSKRRVGALIVIEQKTMLGEVIESGTSLDAIITAELLENIFEPNTPLHDGAVVIRHGRIEAAACFLPLIQSTELSHELGARHRAALGVSADSDALTLVVSEETGSISCARGGKLERHLDDKQLYELLNPIFNTEDSGNMLSTLIAKWRLDNNGSKRQGRA